jgi:hypothetical protein
MLKVLDGPIIEAGDSLSSAIDCSGGQLVRITMPEAWDEAPLTFEFSTDGTLFNDMFDLKGFAVAIEHVVPGSGVIIPLDVGRAIAWIKFRSGHRGQPVEQKEGRLFAVAIEVDDEAAPASASRRTPKRAVKKAAKKKKPRR